MVRARARLIAAIAFAGGIVSPAVAQAPADAGFAARSFEVLPPRRLPMPNLASASESDFAPAGFFSSPPRPPSNESPPPNPGATSWLTAPRPTGDPNLQRSIQPQGTTVMPLFGRPPPPARPFVGPSVPPLAPAWRWHGYGSVNSGAVQSAIPNIVPTTVSNPALNVPDAPPPITLPMPTAQPLPVGPVLQMDPRGPTTLPSYIPPAAPVEAVPLPSGPNEPSWRPMDGRSGALPAGDPGIIGASYQTRPTTANFGDVAPASFIPTASAPPPPSAANPNSTSDGPLLTLRSTIETVCANQGRDLEMFYRGPNHLLIRLKVRQAADAERVANLISRLPEVAPFHVVYEIAVAP